MVIKTKSLTPNILHIVRDKGTEFPGTGELNNWDAVGTYLCRQCGLPLFRSHTKFHSGCGWPSFDEEISGNVLKQSDADGLRTEILCARCHAHLGHVFAGEGYTQKNIRHCVNSLSLDFIHDQTVEDTEEAILAGGCFWGTEYLFKKLPGVLNTQVGYTGGSKNNPSYEEVCSGRTGHYEAMRIIYDPKKLNYEELLKYFFEIHDPTQKNGQGPDIGQQYLSVVFYFNEEQKAIAQKLIKILKEKNYDVATQVLEVSPFWPAEQYHQDYYSKNNKTPYCHRFIKRF